MSTPPQARQTPTVAVDRLRRYAVGGFGTRVVKGNPLGAFNLRVFRSLETVPPFERRPVLTIGNFDGVHRAHQAIVGKAKALAREPATETVVLTFEPHPIAILAPHKSPLRLMPLDEKLRCLELAGADTVAVARAEPKLLSLEAGEFVRDVLRERFNPRSIVEGRSFGFGRGRGGDVEFLRRSCEEFGCGIHIVEPVTITRQGSGPLIVSSSLIRRMLAEGDVEGAALCLGRPYALLGRVMEGERRGRTIGFPTANLRVEDQLVPRDGVYAGWSAVAEQRFASAINIGPAPTFGTTERRIEAHLLDFAGDLYGNPLRLEIVARLRGQRTYSTKEELAQQLHRDVRSVRAALEKEVTNENKSESS